MTLETKEHSLKHPQKIVHREIESPDTSLTSWVIWDNLCLPICVLPSDCFLCYAQERNVTTSYWMQTVQGQASLHVCC